MLNISWLILTLNRFEKSSIVIPHNRENAGYPVKELVWVDNGSTDGIRDFMASLKPNVSVLYDHNTGVARGYNTAMVMSTGDWMVITGNDMIMPDNWLGLFAKYIENIPNTHAVSMYHKPTDQCPERLRGERVVENGLELINAQAMGRRIYSRALLKKAGYLREDFGLYGWEDVEWAHRTERVCRENSWRTYVIPDLVPKTLEHFQGIETDKYDNTVYVDFKRKEGDDPDKRKLFQWYYDNNTPYFSPF
ncbi:Glycosyl transferase family 2 [uncultured archaeon]|nr:Glycosyl transferase family 2 [uncultured archaeon]